MAEDNMQHIPRDSGNQDCSIKTNNTIGLNISKGQIKERLAAGNVDSYDLVQWAMSSEEMAMIVKEFILANRDRIDDTDLADKISKEIICDIENQVDTQLALYSKYTLNVPQSSSDNKQITAKFFCLISLLKDVSVLGRKLLEAAPRFEVLEPNSPNPTPNITRNSEYKPTKSCPSLLGEDVDATSDDLWAALIESSSLDDFLVLSSSLDSISLRDMILAAHILIKSHECFTLSHDVQSVLVVLRRIKFMILNILAPKDQMELVTKLLTSIGRYREMNYVFDLFRDRNQFELLLSKGVEKTPELRIALFNYAKKDPEIHALVTLNFSMFREIAESLEASAMRRLDKLKSAKKNTEHYKLRQRQEHSRGSKKTEKEINPLSIGSGCVVEVASKLKQNQGLQGQRRQCQQDGQQQQRSTTTRNVLDSAGRESLSSSISATSMIKSPSFLMHRKQRQQQEKEHSCSSADCVSATRAEESEKARKTTGDCDKRAALYSKDSLNLCLVELVDASDCFAKAGCYKRSNSCERKAKLIALQLALLPSGTNVLQLKQSELSDLIVSFESFTSAYIVAEAYNYHLAWRQALFRNVILRYGQSSSARYLDEFCMKCNLSSALVMELVFLYEQHIFSSQRTESTPAATMTSNDCSTRRPVGQTVATSTINAAPTADLTTGNCKLDELSAAMRMVLARLKDVESRCKMYTQLNFLDAKEQLLQDAATQAYLKDLKLA